MASVRGDRGDVAPAGRRHLRRLRSVSRLEIQPSARRAPAPGEIIAEMSGTSNPAGCGYCSSFTASPASPWCRSMRPARPGVALKLAVGQNDSVVLARDGGVYDRVPFVDVVMRYGFPVVRTKAVLAWNGRRAEIRPRSTNRWRYRSRRGLCCQHNGENQPRRGEHGAGHRNAGPVAARDDQLSQGRAGLRVCFTWSMRRCSSRYLRRSVVFVIGSVHDQAISMLLAGAVSFLCEELAALRVLGFGRSLAGISA